MCLLIPIFYPVPTMLFLFCASVLESISRACKSETVRNIYCLKMNCQGYRFPQFNELDLSRG